ncbi:hypothetical protein [Polaribacter sp. Asnod1-A03]|uniref:hypothetical protein n=1 Tax=Polaribacter sp. Asnod1-A03 TaxID=3160581 RepID=UPI00386446EB
MSLCKFTYTYCVGCVGHNDEQADIDLSTYDWLIENHVNIIQTDIPKLLFEYLRSKKITR